MFGKQIKNVGKKIHGENVHIGDETNYYTTISVNLPAAGDAVDEYCGHEADLEAVLGMLNEGNRVLIHTWGGFGKTEFARKLAQRGFKRSAYLIDCSDSPASALAKCAEGGKDERGRTAAAVEELNELDNGSLIIFDNVQNGNHAKYIIDSFGNAQASILVTSRLEINRGFRSGLKSFELKPLDDKEAVEMFRRYHIAPNDGGERRAYSEEEKQTVEQIVGLSGNHTLTLELLAKTCRFSGKKPSQILSVMREKGFSLEGINTKISANNSAEDRKFIEHLEMLFDITGISEEHPELIPLLKKLCVLDVTQIPSDALVKWCCEEDNNGLNELAKLGWLREKGLEYTMHNVVSEVLRRKLEPTFEDIESIAKVLKKEFDTAWNDVKLRYKPQPAQAQTLALLKAFEEKEKKKLLGDIALKAGLLSKEQGSYENALWLDDRCIEIYKTDSTDLAIAYNNIAAVYYAKGEYTIAIEHYEKALQIDERMLGKKNIDTAKVYNNIAACYAEDNPDLALFYFKKALAIYKEVLGKKHPEIAKIYGNMAVCYFKDNPEVARFYCKKALAIYKNVLDKEHPEFARIYNNMARCFDEDDRPDLALSYCESALAINKKVLGMEHPETARIYNNMGALYYKLGKPYDDAAANLARAYSIRKKCGLEKDAQNTLSGLSTIYSAKGGDPSDKAAFFEWVKKLISSLD